MEPLKPETKKFLLEALPQADPEEVEEYERLLAERFTVDPDIAKAPDEKSAHQERESRLAELHQKLFSKS
jgi:hypothetical protein